MERFRDTNVIEKVKTKGRSGALEESVTERDQKKRSSSEEEGKMQESKAKKFERPELKSRRKSR